MVCVVIKKKKIINEKYTTGANITSASGTRITEINWEFIMRNIRV